MNKKILLGLAISASLFSSCSSDNWEEGALPTVKESQTSQNMNFLCSTLDFEQDETTRAALSRNYWTKDYHIYVVFMNGTPIQQQKFIKYLEMWNMYLGNGGFYFTIFTRKPQNADIKPDEVIRVGFNYNGDDSSWSNIGPASIYYDKNKPTLNLGWVTDDSDEASDRAIILHELGHAFGLQHEHQHPQHNIQWNKEAVYEYFRKTNGWSDSNIDKNVLNKLNYSDLSNYSQYDRNSIMLYSFPSYLTTNNMGTPWNTVLSQTDKQFMKNTYAKITGESSITLQLLRYKINGEYYYTNDPNEYDDRYFDGYISSLIPESKKYPHHYPLYRYVSPQGKQFITRSKLSGSYWKLDKILGYAGGGLGARTVYYYYNSNKDDYFLSRNPKEVKKGYSYFGKTSCMGYSRVDIFLKDGRY